MALRIWALVTDGMRARILRRLDSVDGEDPVELFSTSGARHLRDSMAITSRDDLSADDDEGDVTSDAPGGPIRKDMEEFAHDILGFLELHRRADDFERLAIFAGPLMLGVLQMALPASLKHILVAERALNLITLPEPELRKRVLQLIHENDKRRGA